MAGQNRSMEGDANQRRKAAREAKAQGKLPSEMNATTGASKQRKHLKHGEGSHQERLETRQEGKANAPHNGGARPGNRDQDPKRTNRWG